MVVENNDVIHNGMDGIRILTNENRVQSNRVMDNGILGIYVPFGLRNVFRDNVTGSSGLLDLVDFSGLEFEGTATCLNEWFGNTWGPLGPLTAEFGFETMYLPDCTTTGGSGPNPPTSG